MNVYFIFWAPESGRPCQYTGMKMLLDMSLNKKKISISVFSEINEY